MAKLLSLGAHVNAQDEDGNTPLFYAFRYRVSAAAINLLLDHGAAPMIENKLLLSGKSLGAANLSF